MENNLQKLESLYTLIQDDKVSTEDFIAAFEQIREIIFDLKKEIGSSFDEVNLRFQKQVDSIFEKINGLNKYVDYLLNQETTLNNIKEGINVLKNDIKNIKSSIDSNTEYKKVVNLVNSLNNKISQEIDSVKSEISNSKDIIEIEKLKEEIISLKLKMDKKSVSNSNNDLVIGGSRPIKIFDNGSKISSAVNEINFIGATVTHNNTSGRSIDVEVTGGTGGVGTWSTPVETPSSNGSTTVFTVGSSAPTDLLIDGAIYPSGTVWTYGANQVTVSIGGAGPTSFIRYR